MSSRGWRAIGGPTFYDRDMRKTREFDFKSHIVSVAHVSGSKDVAFQAFYVLAGDVKKLKNPWIVLKGGPQESWELTEAWRAPVFAAGFSGRERKGLHTVFSENGLANEKGWLGHGIHESFKKPSDKSRWYSSVVSICKAADHVIQSESWKETKVDDLDVIPEHYPYITVVRPVIVLDGVLYEAGIAADGTLEVEHTDSAVLRFEFLSPRYKRHTYQVDLVTMAGLPRYLEIAEERSSGIFGRMGEIVARRSRTYEDVLK
jgi:hypothetical protein